MNLIKKWKEHFDSCLEQKYNAKPNWKETGELVALLTVIAAALGMNGVFVDELSVKIICGYFVVVMLLVAIFSILIEIEIRVRHRTIKKIMRFYCKIVFCPIFMMLIVFWEIFERFLKEDVECAKKPENIFTYLFIVLLELFSCQVFDGVIQKGIVLVERRILYHAEITGYQIQKDALTAFLLVSFWLLTVLVFEFLALHIIRARKYSKNISKEQIQYDEYYYKCNLSLTKIYFLMALFLIGTFSPQLIGQISQSDFINALTVWTVIILCCDKRRELYAKLSN